MKKDPRVYLDDILEALEKIENYIAGFSFEEFSRDNKTVDATIRNFEIIGEAVKKVPERTQKEISSGSLENNSCDAG